MGLMERETLGCGIVKSEREVGWERERMMRWICQDVGCNRDCYVSVFCTEMQAYVHEVMG
jgi:hypothetical protein